MNYNEITSMVLQGVLIPAILAVGGFICAFIKKKTEEVAAKTDNAALQAAIEKTSGVVIQAVNCTAQTYVDELKKANKFDSDSAKEAFSKTKQLALKMIDTETRRLVEETYGNFDIWITSKIEETVAQNY